MAARSSWKGYLKLSLVSVPLKAYTATSSGGSPIRLNQLHKDCNSRIKYQKVCPTHGEVAAADIVMGYEFAKGQYVIVNPDEIDQLRTESDRSISVDAFVTTDAVDPIYHTGKTYYLVPDGPVGQKPYNLLRECMEQEGLHAVARVVISNREQVVLLRPIENLLAMTILEYDAQIKKPVSFADEVVEMESSAEELELTRTLIHALTKDEIDLSSYTDVYTERMTELIETKVQGKELVTPPADEEPQVINLMDALKASVQQVKVPTKAAAAQKKPAKKVSASKKKRTTKKKTTVAEEQQRKSG